MEDVVCSFSGQVVGNAHEEIKMTFISFPHAEDQKKSRQLPDLMSHAEGLHPDRINASFIKYLVGKWLSGSHRTLMSCNTTAF